MEDQVRASAQQRLQAWIQERHRVLLEQIMLTWDEGVHRLNPDAALMEELGTILAPPVASTLPAETDRDLGSALDLIAVSTSQGDVLKRLLEAVQAFAERSALFVVKQGIANLYAARGFESDQPRMGSAVVPPPELDALIQGRHAHSVKTGQAYAALLAPLSRFEASDARVLPLRLRQRVVALLLVDSGVRQVIDHPNHVRALSHAAEATLAALAVAKEEEKPPAPAPPSSLATQPAPEPLPPHAMRTQRIVDPIALQEPSTLDPKVRQNAERSARVLVGDIELYFPQKVEQGRLRGNLYGLLRDELDRSRASFIERYGSDVEAQHRIFYQTVVHQLCGGDASLLGQAPWPERNQGDK